MVIPRLDRIRELRLIAVRAELGSQMGAIRRYYDRLNSFGYYLDYQETNPNSSFEEREVKRRALLELVRCREKRLEKRYDTIARIEKEWAKDDHTIASAGT